MNIRYLLTAGALLTAVAIPTVAPAQRYNRGYRAPTYGRTSYGRGPFYPSYVPAPSLDYFGAGIPLSAGGATVYFGSGGGYYGDYGPVYYGGPRYYGHRSYSRRSYGYRRGR